MGTLSHLGTPTLPCHPAPPHGSTRSPSQRFQQLPGTRVREIRRSKGLKLVDGSLQGAISRSMYNPKGPARPSCFKTCSRNRPAWLFGRKFTPQSLQPPETPVWHCTFGCPPGVHVAILVAIPNPISSDLDSAAHVLDTDGSR